MEAWSLSIVGFMQASVHTAGWLLGIGLGFSLRVLGICWILFSSSGSITLVYCTTTIYGGSLGTLQFTLSVRRGETIGRAWFSTCVKGRSAASNG